jgi:predicted MarR family transcription regulator
MSKGTAIVSSAHLAEGSEGLSEYEFALITCHNAFNRWMVRCMAAAGTSELSSLEVLVLHNVNHRARDKRLSEICFTLNIEDTHLVNYALKKLRNMGLVESTRSGKEVTYRTSAKGQEACARYREVRQACLVETLDALGGISLDDLASMARRIRALSGHYDQAARAASSL